MKRIYKVYFLCLFAVIIFNVLFVSATVVLHETSHFLLGIYFNCEEIKIVLVDYPKLNTYTEMRCLPTTPVVFIAVAPLILVTLFAILLLLLENLPERYFGLVITGFNLMISASDIIGIAPTFLFFPVLLIGMLLVIIGQALFINQFLQLFMKRGS